MKRCDIMALVLGCFLGCCLGLSGCSLDETKDNVQTVRDLTNTAAPYIPVTHTYIPAAISVLSTAALAIIRILKERRNTQLMKDAIRAKAAHIDILTVAADNPGTEKKSPILTGLSKLHKISTPEIKDALNRFDAVRKGYI